MGRIITLTTDFGVKDAYVAAMKGVILGINPDAVIVDICHSIEPQNIAQAAFVLSTACEYFPEGTIHVTVVDPGVGSHRRAILLKKSGAIFIAPDNGVLSHIIGGKGELPPQFQAISLTNSRFWHHPVSSTFHGRDIFAPVAGHVSLGVRINKLGHRIDSLVVLSTILGPEVNLDGQLTGCIIHIDHFGNLITNIRREHLDTNDVCVEVSDFCVEGLSASYAEGDRLLALIGSSGYLEIAARNDSAVRLLKAKVGDAVRIRI